LQTSQMIYDNIDRGVYDLSNDRSGIRVGNEQFAVNKPPGGATPTPGQGPSKVTIGTRNQPSESKGMCC